MFRQYVDQVGYYLVLLKQGLTKLDSNVAAPTLCFTLIQPILRTLPPRTAFAPCLIVSLTNRPDHPLYSNIYSAWYCPRREHRRPKLPHFFPSEPHRHRSDGPQDRLARVVRRRYPRLRHLHRPHLASPPHLLSSIQDPRWRAA